MGTTGKYMRNIRTYCITVCLRRYCKSSYNGFIWYGTAAMTVHVFVPAIDNSCSCCMIPTLTISRPFGPLDLVLPASQTVPKNLSALKTLRRNASCMTWTTTYTTENLAAEITLSCVPQTWVSKPLRVHSFTANIFSIGSHFICNIGNFLAPEVKKCTNGMK